MPKEFLDAIKAAVLQALAEQQTVTPSEWLDEESAAALVGMERRYLARHGCPRHKIGRTVRYRRSEVLAWFEARA